MARVKSRDTTPEKLLRSALRKAGFRFRTCDSKLPGKPDIVIPSRRMAIFVDGDFWHGRQWKTRRHASLEGQFTKSASRQYWLTKIRRNMTRDLKNTAALLEDGWRVARFWETDVHRDTESCVSVLSTPAASDSLSLIPRRTVAEFFAGIGLMRCAFERQGWQVAFANDIDPKKLQMYEAQFGDSFALCDVRALDVRSVPCVSLATASFPCTDLSLAGGRHGLDGKHSSAFWGFLRVLENMGDSRPPLVLVENVPGFLTSGGGKDLRAALLGLNDLGYAVDMFTLDASHFVPQSRNRLFIVGQPGGELSGERSGAVSRFMKQNPDIDWTTRPLPSPPESTLSLAALLEPLADWWEEDRSAYLLSQMVGPHREAADEAIRKRRWTYGTIFRRVRNGKTVAELRTDGIAGCLRTPRGGSARQILFKAGYGKYYCRLLTARECARLMGADDYKIDTRQNQALFGFGDAVCVPAIEWIIIHYLVPLSNDLIRGRVLIR
jgi:DNA (cytosine-5)-methyltransferase 1